MEEENRPLDTIPSDSDVKSEEGEKEVSDVTPKEGETEPTVEALTLDSLNKTLKREFKSPDDALKSIKETYSFVGKKKEDITPEPQAPNEELAEIKNELYFTKNPELEVARPILEALAKANGQTLQEAAESDIFKTSYEKMKGYDENQQKDTVMEGNRRFDGGSTDKQKEFESSVGDKEKMARYVLKHHLPIEGK